MITQLREKSQITIPKEVIKKLKLKVGDSIDIDVEDNNIILKPVVIVPKDQAWFWSKEWQQDEKQADKDIKNGETKKFNSVQELFDDLDN
ncbi:AbrB/MazE/SpoVT family DNA-binding domain-containing protein (plasmid) [Clostridium tyrobutyricum]|jgi:AbrB family looped-hinge helix DNA binding protein|uniref:Transcriptional regulator, AbrB family n=1 Tax=Clostridium tyrobutyricum DIVETGP TaxID=1408889 RepID=W6NGR9_CLOTY|nr:AbrB/MazE/SpoVT family DNA-binding domain-containing protein [Clostridium tyrobutyricum]AND86312.1 transcriptional regulator [Clostridium tyrobutyricum]ANP70943.1 AbrB family transcriptional regulator [Clostridium tyrobutyricum]MBV4432637.1 AbrB/MazE/SpoVT family DNA-binding domain-containing protein [Clostridium tyrobutyricum]MBV4435802.1 AbrB/MazE/SpoVT family DNA-binding domain-containing protein [Clostridium tyrobutyricum]QCH29388.1 SpoVT / AbrB like domain protein [Clostridium tyrobuty